MLYFMLASMPVFVCGVLAMVLLLDQILWPQRARKMMMIFMISATLLYLGHCVYFLHETKLLPISDTIYCTCNPLVFPLYFLYIKSLTELRTPLWHVIILVLPAVVCGLAVGLAYWLTPNDAVEAFIDQYLYHSPSIMNNAKADINALVFSHHLVKVVFSLEIIVILFLGIRRINRYHRLLEHYYSSPENKQLTWVKIMLILFVVTSLNSILYNVVGRHYFIGETSKLAIPSILYSTLLFAIGYIGLKQQGIERWKEEEAKPMTPPPSAVKLSDQIEQLMIKEKLYLNPQLKLSDLVMQLNSNRNYVYHAINVEMGISFAEYVNRKRINHAEKLMKEFPKMPLSEIASRSGFASSTSFYRNFKTIRGCSPTKRKEKI